MSRSITRILLQIPFFTVTLLAFPPADSTAANIAYSEALSLHRKGEYETAITGFRRAAAIFDSLGYAEARVRCLNYAGTGLRVLGRDQEAETQLMAALDIARSAVDSTSKQYAFSYEQLAYISRKAMRYDESLDYLQKSLTIRRNRYGENSKLVAISYNSIGGTYYAMGDLANARTYFERSLAAAEKRFEPEDTRIFPSYLNLANVLAEAGDYDRAVEEVNKGIEIVRNVRGEDHPDMARGYVSLARIYLMKDDPGEVILLTNRALPIIRDRLGEQHRQLVYGYNRLATAYRRLGDVKNAGLYMEKAIDMAARALGENDRYLGSLKLQASRLKFDQEQYAEALSLARDANDIYLSVNPEFPPRAKALYRAGNSLAELGNPLEARQYYLEALDLSRRTRGNFHQDIAQSYYGLAELAARRADWPEAIRQYDKAIQALYPEWSTNSQFDPPPLNGAISDVDAAEILLGRGTALVNSVTGTGKSAKKQAALALANLSRGVELIVEAQRKRRSDYSRLNLAGLLQQLSNAGTTSAYGLYEKTSNKAWLEDAFRFAEYGKAALLRQAMEASEAASFAGIPGTLLVEERRLRGAKTQLENKYMQEQIKPEGKNTRRVEVLQAQYFAARQAYEQHITMLEKRFPEYYRLKYDVEPMVPSKLVQILDDRTTLISYEISDGALYAFLINKSGLHCIKTDLPGMLVELTADFRRSIVRPEEHNRFAEISAQLYTVLIRPLEKHINSSSNLVIIPDEQLAGIPFEALLSSEQILENGHPPVKNYLLHRFHISYHYSAGLYAEEQVDRFPDPASMYALGAFAPVFTGESGKVVTGGTTWLEDLGIFLNDAMRGGDGFAPLPHTEDEVRGIIAAFNEKDRRSIGFLQEKATESYLKETISDYHIVHLATHSFANTTQPGLSGIAFHQGSETEDGILFAGEIYNLEMNADLVVLSSCESGIGKVVAGEGLLALTRGFIYSGAQNVLVSLWKVLDRYTKELMVEFYRNVLEGKPYPDALRDAKLHLLENDKTAYPVVWSSFVLIGRPDPAK